jgi:hypothetical protein
MSVVYQIVVAGDGEAWERLLAEQEAAVAERALRGPEVALRAAERERRRDDGVGRHFAFAPLRLARAVLAAVEAGGGLALEPVREVTGAHFDFSVEAFAEPAARQIRAVLGQPPPPGVELIRHPDEEQERDADGTGPDRLALSSPLHCDAYRVRGRVEGALAGVVEMRLRLHSLPFVHEDPIELAARPIDQAALVEGHEGTAADTAAGGDDG